VEALLVTLFQDIRYAVRILLKNPGFTLIAALSLALGIGANSAIFSLADAVLLRPLPVLAPGAVVTVSTNTPDNPYGGVSYPDYRDLRAKSQSFDGMVAYQLSTMSAATSPKALPQIRTGLVVSDNWFQVLGVQPVLGRAFLPEEGKVPGRDAVVVVSYDFWENQLARDPSVIGRNLRIKGIDLHRRRRSQDLHRHRPVFPTILVRAGDDGAAAECRSGRPAGKSRGLPLHGKSAPETWRIARDGPGRPGHRLERPPAAVSGNKPKAQHRGANGAASRVQHSGPDAALIALLMGLVGVVLLIACANVASLLLGRARARAREIALRISLGATRMRLLRQLLTESLLLSLLGGALGLWIGYGGILFLQTIRIPNDPPITVSPRLDARVLIFSIGAAVLSAVLFGLVPALRSLKTELVPALKASSAGLTVRGRTIGRNVLVVGQVALSMVLLVAAGMLLDGFRKMLRVDPGFSTDHRLMIELDTSLVRYTPGQTRDFYRKLADHARAVPGVRSATLARSIPFLPNQFATSVAPEGYQFPKGQDTDSLVANIVDEQYFATMKTQIIRGRAFTPDDKDESRRVAIVNEEFAKSYWPNQEPLGKRFRLNSPKDPLLEVVGLTKTAKYLFVGETPTKFLYLPFAQNQNSQMLLIVQTDGDPASIATPMREVVQGIDANQPVFNVRTLDSFYQQRAVAVPWMIVELVTTLGLLGLTLAVIGLYGLIAYSVSRRTQEIGIRMAIGANKRDVLKMIIRQGLTLSLLGIAVGGLASIAVARLLAAGLAGLGSMSPVTFVAVPILLVLVTLTACYIPARRASLVDPMVALRYE
jgi:predicted permease